MIELTVVDDLRSDLRSAISSQVSVNSQGIPEDNFVVVGEECNGTLIYSWNGRTSESLELVTHIGVYNRNTKLRKEVYMFDRCTKVVNATISPEESFLAFVTLEQNASNGQGIYAAYIAEIRPANHLYSLSLETTFYILLQFVYANETTVGPGTAMFLNTTGLSSVPFGYAPAKPTRIHLVVIRHMESVGIYHLSAARVGDQGLIMNAEPQKEQLLHKWVVWAQWDLTHLCLYVLQIKKKDIQQDSDALPLLIGYQFTENGTFREIVRLTVDLPITCSKTRLKYLELSPCKFIPVSNLNFQVLQHRSNGTICICYQHSANSNKHRNRKSSDSLVQLNLYTVLVLHCNKMLQAKHSQPLPVKSFVTFAWFGDQLLVHLPGLFSHLLNISLNVEPSHHLLWQDTNDLGTVFMSLCLSSSAQSENHSENGRHHALLVFTSKERSGLELYDPQSKCISKVSVKDDELVKMFCDAEDIETRLAILHYVVRSSLSVLIKLFEIIKAHVFFRDISSLIEEYLVSSAFEYFQWQVDASLHSLIPFTSYRSSLSVVIHEKSHQYLPVWSQDSVPNAMASSSKQQPSKRFNLYAVKKALSCKHSDDSNLPQHMKQQPSKRFNLYAVKKALSCKHSDDSNLSSEASTEMDVVEDADSQKVRQHRTDQALRYTNLVSGSPRGTRIRPLASGAVSQTELILGKAPPFLGSNSDMEALIVDRKQVIQKTIELLEAHLTVYRSHLMTPLKIRKVIQEYIRCQLRSSKMLLHIMWSICMGKGRGKGQTAWEGGTCEEMDDCSLSSPPSVCEFDLLRFLECYCLVTDRLSFPRPVSFSSYFASLVFRCRNRVTFLQHLDHGVMSVDLSFCIKVIKELDDSLENVRLKMQLIHHLEQADMFKCYKLWGHPHVLPLIAQNFATNCMTSDDFSAVRKASLADLDPSLLPPVGVYIRLLKDKGFDDFHNPAVKPDDPVSACNSSRENEEILRFIGDTCAQSEDLTSGASYLSRSSVGEVET